MPNYARQREIFRLLRENTLQNISAPRTDWLTDESLEDNTDSVSFDDEHDRDDSSNSTSEAIPGGFVLAARLLKLLQERAVCDRDSGEEDEGHGLIRLFRSCGEGCTDMNKELFERLDLGEKFDIEDFLLLSTIMNQQQDPNSTSNLLTTILLAKVLGRSGGGRGIETALLLSQMMNTSSQTAATGTGVAPMQNNMMPLLLALTLGRGEESEGIRGLGRRGWREKEEFAEAAPEKKQPRQ